MMVIPENVPCYTKVKDSMTSVVGALSKYVFYFKKAMFPKKAFNDMFIHVGQTKVTWHTSLSAVASHRVFDIILLSCVKKKNTTKPPKTTKPKTSWISDVPGLHVSETESMLHKSPHFANSIFILEQPSRQLFPLSFLRHRVNPGLFLR